MTGIFRGADSVQKLLEVARADAETVRIDLLDIDRGKASARAALAEIADAVAREVGATGDPVAFAAYAEGMRERRVNLKRTLSALETAEETTQGRLTRVLGEIAKLERLAEINARDALVEKRRRDAREGDQSASRRRAAT